MKNLISILLLSKALLASDITLKATLWDGEDGSPIPKAIIEINYGENRKYYYSKRDGSISLEVDHQPKLISISKEGYLDKKIIVDENVANIFMYKQRGTITGRISDGKKTFPGIEVKLCRENGDVVSQTVADINGDYIFNNVPFNQRHRIHVIKEGYLPYVSSRIILKGNPRNIKNVYLATLQHILTVEIKKDNIGVKGVDVVVNGESKKTNSLGIAIFDNCTKFQNNTIRVEELKIEETFKPEVNRYSLKKYNITTSLN